MGKTNKNYYFCSFNDDYIYNYFWVKKGDVER